MNLSAETKSFIRDNLDTVNAFISHCSNVWITLICQNHSSYK